MKASTVRGAIKKMAKNNDQKPAAVKEAEKHGGETFDPTVETAENRAKLSSEELLAKGLCPDCNGEGIRNPETDIRVCQTCEGSGKA